MLRCEIIPGISLGSNALTTRLTHLPLQTAAGAFAVALALGPLALSVSAQNSGNRFYAGKQIRLIVDTAPGGAYDLYGRLLAKFYVHHIPGNPTIIVQDMPGAGGLKAANYMYSVAPRDGTVIDGSHSGIPTAALMFPTAAKFDVNRFSWIGSATSDPYVGYVWHTVPVKTLADCFKTPVVFGSATVGSAGTEYAILARDMFGLKLKIITGYKSSETVKLAMERGELQGTFGNSWTSLKSSKPEWLRDKKIRIIVQHGFKKLPELPNVPLLMDFAKNDADRTALTFMLARQDFAKPYFGPPQLPAGRLAILRQAFDATMRDPSFIAEGHKTGLALDDPMMGAELEQRVKKLSETPPAVVRRIVRMLTAYKDSMERKKK